MFLLELRGRLDLILGRSDRAESCERICDDADAECLVHSECPSVGGEPHAAAAASRSGWVVFAGCVRLWTGFQSSMARPSVGRKDKRYQREAIMVRASLFAAALVSMLPTPLGAKTADFKPVTREMLANPSPDDWLMLNRTYDEQRFSPLREINRDTVAGLELAWARGMAAGTNETIPIVYQGIMYVVSPGAGVLALGATNGDLIWDYSREDPKKMTDFIGPPTAARQKGPADLEDMIIFEGAAGFPVAMS